MTATLNIDPSAISAVHLANGVTVSVRSVEAVAIGGPAKFANALAIHDRDGAWHYLSIGSVVGFKTRDKVRTPEDIEAERRARDEAEEVNFLWRTYAPSRAAYDEAVQRQGGKCAAGPSGICGSGTEAGELAAYPITHYRDGGVYCQMDSNMRPRAGSPA